MNQRVAPPVTTGLGVVVLTLAFAGQALRNLVGWWGYAAVIAIVLVLAVIAIARSRPRLRWNTTPKALLLFLAFATISVVWSYYPGASALGIAAQLATSAGGAMLAYCLTRDQLVSAIGRSLRITVGLSLLFELVVAVFVRAPILPPWIGTPSGKTPDAFYWTLADLFHGGPIQGIVGNRNLLGFVALLGLTIVLIEWSAGLLRRRIAVLWVVLFTATLLLTRSSTVLLCLVAVAAAAGFALWARRVGESGRRPVYATAFILAAAAVVSLLVARGPLLALLGKSEDATGRLDIWRAVWELAAQRPVFGWGWVSYWAPWAAPFDTLAERKGVLYLQAHDAWLDVWFQLGLIGLVLFVALAVSTLWRAWFRAVDRPRRTATGVLPYRAVDLAPLLVLAALLAQSIAESRILIEGGWMLLVAFAILTKRGEQPVHAVRTLDSARPEPAPTTVR
ncbi:O-antigen ligase family protein [Microbacteriaceae bacterium VKM Ac-2855]|nr:O-antigen ligase family protein [Microbacteriaceae bacterium VKM Ac-2855]